MTIRHFRSYTISLTAGSDYILDVAGDIYAIIDNTGTFTLTFDDSNRFLERTSGMSGKIKNGYNKVTFNSPTTQTIIVDLGFGEFNDARASVNATINTTISPSDTINDPPDVTVGVSATLIVPADTDRKEVMIHLPSTATDSIRLGGSGVTTSTGLELEPGSTITLAVESAVYGIRTGSSDETVSILDLTRP